MSIKKLLNTMFKATFRLIISIYLTINIILVSTVLFGTLATADEQVSVDDEFDIDTIGLQWVYERPDKSEEGTPTCWKLRWSPDGEKIAVVYFDNTTIIFEARTGKVIKALGTSAEVIMGEDEEPEESNKTRTRCFGYTNIKSDALLRAVAWSPDGKLLATGGDHRLIEIFNTSTWETEKVLEGHTGSVLSLDWSPDGARLASGEGTDQVVAHNHQTNKNLIKIWDVKSWQELRSLEGHKDGIMSLQWSLDSKKIVSAGDSRDRNLKLWDMDDYSLMFTLGEGLGHSSGVLDVDWSPNQTVLVSSSRDFKIRLWNVSDGMPIGKPWKDNNCVRSAHWHPDSEYIATAGVDQRLKIRNATSGKVLKEFTEAEETNSEVMSARWSPDGKKLAACSSRDATVRLYSTGWEESGSSEFTSEYATGIAIFFLIVIIGIILIYIPLRNEFREHRK